VIGVKAASGLIPPRPKADAFKVCFEWKGLISLPMALVDAQSLPHGCALAFTQGHDGKADIQAQVAAL